MSIQEHSSDSVTSATSLGRAVDALYAVIDFLPPGSQARFVAANSNTNWAHQPAKRILDLAIAVPALIVLLPLLAVLAVLIRLDSPGPILFRQRRIGVAGRPFDIFKLRSMSVLENGETVVQASLGDARVTRMGRWLRAFSLDELPQLVNVVKGDMSLVGPRPHARAHDALYVNLIADYERRRNVKPGLTGWAQIHGLRGPTPTTAVMSRRVAFDVWYADHASLALDLEILLRTPLEVLRRRNAH